MNDIRLLALDVDDTLLQSDFSLSSRTRTVVKNALEQGVLVALISGRIPQDMERFSQLLGMNKRLGFLASNNGSLIQESHTGAIIHETRLDPKTVLAICDFADAEGFPVQMYENNVMYISRRNEFSDCDERLTGVRQVVVENFRAMISEGCYKLLIPGDPEVLPQIKDLILSYLGSSITLFTSRTFFLEIMPENTNKGTALAHIAARVGVRPEQTLAIGDAMSDEAMIRWAGIGVAMANADERLKKIARVISEHTNNEDGVADIIETYILHKRK